MYIIALLFVICFHHFREMFYNQVFTGKSFFTVRSIFTARTLFTVKSLAAGFQALSRK